MLTMTRTLATARPADGWPPAADLDTRWRQLLIQDVAAVCENLEKQVDRRELAWVLDAEQGLGSPATPLSPRSADDERPH